MPLIADVICTIVLTCCRVRLPPSLITYPFPHRCSAIWACSHVNPVQTVNASGQDASSVTVARPNLKRLPMTGHRSVNDQQWQHQRRRREAHLWLRRQRLHNHFAADNL